VATTAEVAKLVAELSLDSRKFNAAVDKAVSKTRGLRESLGRIGGIAGRGLATAARNLTRIAAVGIGGLSIAIKTGLDDLAALENATMKVSGALKQMGQDGQVSASQVARWANEIEQSIGAAFDDKAITDATANLIRFGAVTPDNLREAMQVMTDLAAKTGSVESASSLLGKALADPTKASGRLTRAGVILTKQQQKQIDTLVKAGKVTEAQAVLLDIIAEKTKGAAEATQGPYQRALSTLGDSLEDARKALAEGFMPLIERFAGEASAFFSKPETISNIRSFGERLADAAQAGLEFAKKIPWSAIGDGLRIAADFAGKLFDAFRNLPPDVQATLIALGGLDRLTGGAVSGIAAELGKGLIKGVLSMNAAVVNINAARVTGAGGLGVGGPVAAGGGRIGSALGTAAKIVVPLGVGVAIAEAVKEASGQSESEWQATYEARLKRMGLFGPDAFGGTRRTETTRRIIRVERTPAAATARVATGPAAGPNAANPIKDMTAQTVSAIGMLGSSLGAKLTANAEAVRTGTTKTVSKQDSANAILGRIAAKRTQFSVTVPVSVTTNVSVRDQQQRAAAYQRMAARAGLSVL